MKMIRSRRGVLRNLQFMGLGIVGEGFTDDVGIKLSLGVWLRFEKSGGVHAGDAL